MLKKLLKYDFREMIRSSYYRYILSGAIAFICCGLLYFLKGFEQNEAYAFGVNTAMSIYAFGLIGIFALAVITLYFVVLRYYRYFFTDEGYFNMVIPAETKTLLFAKLLSAFLWVALTVAVAVASLLLATAVPNLLYDPRLFLDNLEAFFTPDVEYEVGFTVAFIILGVIETIVGLCEVISVIFLSVTLGCIVFKRRKIIGIVLFYMVISSLQSYVVGFGEYFMLYETGGDPLFIVLTMLFLILVSSAMAVGAYFLNAHLLKNKFNIE